MKKCLFLLVFYLAAGTAYALPAENSLPVLTEKKQVEMLKQAVDARQEILVDKLKLNGCRPMWTKYQQQIQNMPSLIENACQAFKEAGGDCAHLAEYVYNQIQQEITKRDVRRLLAQYRQGFLTDPQLIALAEEIQVHLILGISPALIAFMPKEYQVSFGQQYDFLLHVDVTNTKMYDYICGASVPAMEKVLREMVRNKEYLIVN